MKRINLFDLTPEEFSELIANSLLEKLKILLPKENQNEFISRKEAAGILKISLPTLRSWTISGRLKSYRIASRIRYRKTEILSALQELPFKRSE